MLYMQFGRFSISRTENRTELINFSKKKEPKFSILNWFSIFLVQFCCKFWFGLVINTPNTNPHRAFQIALPWTLDSSFVHSSQQWQKEFLRVTISSTSIAILRKRHLRDMLQPAISSQILPTWFTKTASRDKTGLGMNFLAFLYDEQILEFCSRMHIVCVYASNTVVLDFFYLRLIFWIKR